VVCSVMKYAHEMGLMARSYYFNFHSTLSRVLVEVKAFGTLITRLRVE
jgi:hypothetical protein